MGLDVVAEVSADQRRWKPKDYERRLLRLEPRKVQLLEQLWLKLTEALSESNENGPTGADRMLPQARVVCGTNPDAFAKGMRKHIRAACRKAGLPQLHKPVHDLRRSIATLLAQRGVPPYVLQLLMGHSDLDTVTVEYYVDRRKTDAAGEAMAAIVAGQNSSKEVTNR